MVAGLFDSLLVQAVRGLRVSVTSVATILGRIDDIEVCRWMGQRLGGGIVGDFWNISDLHTLALHSVERVSFIRVISSTEFTKSSWGVRAQPTVFEVPELIQR